MERDVLMNRIRGVDAIRRSTWGDDERCMFGFLAVIHPEISLERRFEIIRGMRDDK